MGGKSGKKKGMGSGIEVPEMTVPSPLADPAVGKKKRNRFYEKELRRLHIELVKLQETIKREGLKVVVIFEGRDAAGKGGVIKRISEPLNPRVCRVVALGTPTDRQKTQWYFQRYAAELPAAGEMVLLDRSWYNRAGVERVMGFCKDAEYWDFLRSVPEFERMLVRSGIHLIKYWFSVSDEVQEERFRGRVEDPTKRWKLSPMDLESRNKWQQYSQAKDRMLVHTDIERARWYVVNSNDKKRARLNCIAHLLSLVPHMESTPARIDLPKRAPEMRGDDYVRPPLSQQNFVPEIY
jgi:polyphosphate kinase 2